jgi:hypothetical protein
MRANPYGDGIYRMGQDEEHEAVDGGDEEEDTGELKLSADGLLVDRSAVRRGFRDDTREGADPNEDVIPVVQGEKEVERAAPLEEPPPEDFWAALRTEIHVSQNDDIEYVQIKGGSWVYRWRCIEEAEFSRTLNMRAPVRVDLDTIRAAEKAGADPLVTAYLRERMKRELINPVFEAERQERARGEKVYNPVMPGERFTQGRRLENGLYVEDARTLPLRIKIVAESVGIEAAATDEVIEYLCSLGDEFDKAPKWAAVAMVKNAFEFTHQ